MFVCLFVRKDKNMSAFGDTTYINISNMDSLKEKKKMRVAKVEKGETLLQIDIHFGS